MWLVIILIVSLCTLLTWKLITWRISKITKFYTDKTETMETWRDALGRRIQLDVQRQIWSERRSISWNTNIKLIWEIADLILWCKSVLRRRLCRHQKIFMKDFSSKLILSHSAPYVSVNQATTYLHSMNIEYFLLIVSMVYN